MILPPTQDLGRLLVTGATGQVGRRLVSTLLGRGHDVDILTRSPEAAERLWPSGAVKIHRGDLREPGSLDALPLAALDTVIHLASYKPGPAEPDIYNAPNHWPITAEGTAHLMDRIAGSRVGRLVYVSSIKAMGDRAGALGRPADEAVEPMPDTLYGRAKLAAETQVLGLGARTGIKASVMRLPMVYGIGDAGNIPRMIAAVAARRFPPWPRIANHRSAIHVDDAVAATLLIARSTRSGGEVYCVTDGHSYSTRWMYEQILHALGRPVPRWTVPLGVLRLAASAGSAAERLLGRPMPLTLEGLSKLTGDAWFSSAKLGQELGFTPRHSLADEIPRLTRDLET